MATRVASNRVGGTDSGGTEERVRSLTSRPPESVPPTRLLATLVAMGNLEVKIASPRYCGSPFHDKLGVFHDADGRRVSFVGSANETWAAWQLNHESFEVFCSWRGESDLLRTRRHDDEFNRLWIGLEPGLIVEPLETP